MDNKKIFKVESDKARFGKSYKMKTVTINRLDIKISGADTEGQLSVFEQTGYTLYGGPPMHKHFYQDEWFYILAGNFIFQSGNDKFEMKPGDTIYLPKNIPHAFIQLTEEAKVIVSYLPAGKMENFFKKTDEITSSITKEEVYKLFADHDMEVVGPPLKV